MKISSRIAAAILCSSFCGPAVAQSFRIRVAAKDDIFRAGDTKRAPVNFGLGHAPPSVTLPAGTQCITVSAVTGSLSCASPAGCITVDLNEGEGTHYNDPDGAGAYPKKSSNTGKGSISGLTAPYAGYLTGVFTPAGGPSGPAPAALDFTKGKGTGFKRLAPLLDQSFFMGDGLTGDGTGATQKFMVPANATTLYVGISDAAGFNGPPGAYIDNRGAFHLVVHASPNACPVRGPLKTGLAAMMPSTGLAAAFSDDPNNRLTVNTTFDVASDLTQVAYLWTRTVGAACRKGVSRPNASDCLTGQVPP